MLDSKPGWRGWLWQHLRRVTTSGRYFPEIEGLRFIAIAAVFLYHARGYLAARSNIAWDTAPADDWLAGLTLYGNYGVPLFFGISGFILALPFAAHHLAGDKGVGLGPYFLRRLTRLEPPYLVSLLLCFTLLIIVNGKPAAELAPNLFANGLYLHNLIGPGESINGVAWSLEVEVQFYLLAPWLCAIFRLRPAWFRRGVLIALTGAAVFVSQLIPETWPLTLLSFLQFFLAGLLAADFYVCRWQSHERRSLLWDAALLSSPLAMFVPMADGGTLLPWVLPVLLFLTVAGALRSRVISGMLRWPFVTTVGGMCYSIYLLHYQVISAVGRWTKDVGPSQFWAALMVQAVILGIAVLLVCGLFFVLVERPCMYRDWPQRLWACWRSRMAGLSSMLGGGAAKPAAYAAPGKN